MIRASQAFTLIEIMVALAIITIALGAIIENTTASNRNAQYLRDKTVAGWVAMNQISTMRASRQWDARRSLSGEVEMAGQDWRWEMKVVTTEDPNVRRLEVEVFKADAEQSTSRLEGFLGKL